MAEIKQVNWRWDWGVYVPFCPYCDEPAYEQDGCVFCEKPYQWVEGKYKPTEVTQGEYTVVQATNNHISIYKNGECVYHASCTKKKTEEELLGFIKYFEEAKTKCRNRTGTRRTKPTRNARYNQQRTTGATSDKW